MTTIQQRVICIGIACAGCAALLAADPPEKQPAEAHPPAAERKFLERFVGEWEGEGESDGRKVRDAMRFEWALGNRFIRFTYKALDGDDYKGEGYVWYNPARERYEWWEFNNGKWPVRQHTGRRDKDLLKLEETSTDRKLRLTFRFTADDTLLMAESFVEGDKLKPYVNVTFHRTEPKAR